MLSTTQFQLKVYDTIVKNYIVITNYFTIDQNLMRVHIRLISPIHMFMRSPELWPWSSFLQGTQSFQLNWYLTHPRFHFTRNWTWPFFLFALGCSMAGYYPVHFIYKLDVEHVALCPTRMSQSESLTHARLAGVLRIESEATAAAVINTLRLTKLPEFTCVHCSHTWTTRQYPIA